MQQSVCAVAPWHVKPAEGDMGQEQSGFEKLRTTPVAETAKMSIFKRKRSENLNDVNAPLIATPLKKQRVGQAVSQPTIGPRAHLPDTRVDQGALEAKSGNGEVAPAQNRTRGGLVPPPKLDTNLICQNVTPPPTGSSMSTSILTYIDQPQIRDMRPSIAQEAPGLTSLQQVIENEFNLQILSKHDEIRLIDQELAKSQVALEQLRRCELRPYPGSSGPSQAVTSGTGASIAPPSNHTRPVYPAPYGIEDGPYTQHYRQWLIQDPQFTSSPVNTVDLDAALGISGVSNAIRSTRNGGVRKSTAKAADHTVSAAQSLPSLPNYPSAPSRDKSQPLLLRRSTDNELVKLICNNCQRGNFSSIQGFLNHCRIAHKVDYKSHDAAAIDCGRLLEDHEAATLPPEAINPPAPKGHTHVRRPSANVPTAIHNSVHPLNTTKPAPLRGNSHRNGDRQPAPMRNLQTQSAAAPMTYQPFTPSPQVPRLSAHFAKYQLGGDLAKATASAKEKIDMGTDEDLASPDGIELSSPLASTAGSRTVVGAGRPGMLAAPGAFVRPPSRKGHRQPAGQKPRPSPLASASLHSMADQASQHLTHQHTEIPESPHDRAINLSPHSHTADSNPGLVSDHEDDDDHGSASEDESPQAAMTHPLAPVRPRHCSENMDIDVGVEDDLDQHGVVIRRNSMFAEDERTMRTSESSSKKLGRGK